jgi:hypothetical protein
VEETDMTITAPAVTEPKTAARNGSYAAADQTTIAAAAIWLGVGVPPPGGTAFYFRPPDWHGIVSPICAGFRCAEQVKMARRSPPYWFGLPGRCPGGGAAARL